MVIGKIPDDAWRSKLALCRMRIQGLGWLGRWNLAWYTYWKIAEACKSMQITSNHQTIGRDYFASICTSSRLPVDILCQRGGFWNYSYRVTSSPNSAHFSWFLDIFGCLDFQCHNVIHETYADSRIPTWYRISFPTIQQMVMKKPLPHWTTFALKVMVISVRPCMLSHSMFPISMPPCSEGGAGQIIYLHR